MTPAQAMAALNERAQHWELRAQRNGGDVWFIVVGRVLPDGHKRRGAMTFFGAYCDDARDALIEGRDAMFQCLYDHHMARRHARSATDAS